MLEVEAGITAGPDRTGWKASGRKEARLELGPSQHPCILRWMAVQCEDGTESVCCEMRCYVTRTLPSARPRHPGRLSRVCAAGREGGRRGLRATYATPAYRHT